MNSLDLDSIRTAPKIRTQNFSITRRDNGEIRVHNREEHEVEEIKEKFYSKEIMELSKTREEEIREAERNMRNNQIETE